MSKFDHRKAIVLDALQTSERLSVDHAARLIDASPATTRRLFRRLASEGALLRIHGGVQAIPQSKDSYSYIIANASRIEQKALIAARAVKLVETGDLLFLDSGTTILKMAELLEGELHRGEIGDIVVVTNSLASYERLCPHCKVILVGGEVRLSRRDTFGKLAELALESLHVHKSFFGADAIHQEQGLMATDEWTCRMNDIMQGNSDSVYVLADSEKFGKRALLAYSRLDAVDRILTDDGVSESDLSVYRDQGARIEIVPSSNQ